MVIKSKQALDQQVLDKLKETLAKYQCNKIGNLRLERVFVGMERLGKAERMRKCSTFLIFEISPDGRYHLAHANFCRERLCPQCAWRRSKKAYYENRLCFDKISGQGRFVFLTVTCKNVGAQDLKDEVTRYFNGFSKMMKNKAVKPYVLGMVKAFEVTYNKENTTFHPHIHCLLHVKDSYFSRGYIRQSKWRDMWKQVMQLDYDPQVDIRAFKSRTKGQDIGRELAEISKYCVKFSDFMDLNDQNFEHVVKTLDVALSNRRLINYSGTFRQARKELKLSDDITDEQEADYDNMCDDTDDKSYQVLYKWIFGKNTYKEASLAKSFYAMRNKKST